MRRYMKKYLSDSDNRQDNRDRKKARRKMEKLGRVYVNDGKEVDHKRGVSAWNWNANLRVISQYTNRSLWAKKAIAVRKRRKNSGGVY